MKCLQEHINEEKNIHVILAWVACREILEEKKKLLHEKSAISGKRGHIQPQKVSVFIKIGVFLA